MKFSFFRIPKGYSDYTFWRSTHHRYALSVMIASLGWYLSQIVFS